MPFFTAAKIHDGHKWLPGRTVIETTEDGTIIQLHDASDGKEVTFCEGVLTPGFVNAHCHLELSHMKGVIPEHLTLIPFLKNIPLYRNDFTDEQKEKARHSAYAELLSNGVVAVGDISNVTDTLDLRGLDKLHIHTFVESLGFAENPQKQFERSVHVYDTFASQKSGTKRLRQSIVPHAPYSVSLSLFRMINAHQKDAVISIHNQESPAEDEYYFSKTGSVGELLQVLGIDDGFFQPSGKSSLQTYLEWLSPSHPFIFVHNTYTALNDLKIAKALLKDPFWCLCPNANLYIESKLPDVGMFVKEHANICIGTDSLASNHQLSILSELQTLRENFPALSWETLLTWGTYNGAKALQMDDIVGSFEPGKKPGIIQITRLEEKDSLIKRVI
ncbi:MAG TPA: amidohydrolase family protein [Flavipsychrobacter sp.]|nr:amidohydrolase family protein [Flavipsychrobacter sp.]